MDGVTVVDHVLLRRLLSILRDKDTPHRVFRETMTDAALILGYEAMRALRGAEIAVETPLETHLGRDGWPTRCSSSRSCAPGSAWSTASCGSCRRRASGISACTATRRPCGPSGTTRTSRRASRTPRSSSSTRCSPPAARGVQAIARLKRAGAQRLHFVCLVAAPEGIAALREAHPDVSITTATIDRELDENGYIRPGLGDAGDRIFGTDR